MIYDIDITERVIGGLTQQSSIVQHNVAVDHIRPHFDAEWDGFAISAIFEKHAQGRLGELKFSMSASDGEPTVIPWELLEDTRDIQLAFVGIKEGERLVTLYSQATLTVRPSGEITGATPKDPTVDQIEAAIAEVREAAGSATDAASKATSAAASANTAKDNADNATRAANAAASAANTAKTNADAAAKEATSAAEAANAAKEEVDAAMETFKTLVSVKHEYATGDSNTQIPQTGWTEDVATVAQGKWLWTKDTFHYSQGEDDVKYGYSYQGIDGNVLQQDAIDALTAKTNSLQTALDSVPKVGASSSPLFLLNCRQLHIAPNNDDSAQFVVYYPNPTFSSNKHSGVILTPAINKSSILSFLTINRAGGTRAIWRLSIDEDGFVKATYSEDTAVPVEP